MSKIVREKSRFSRVASSQTDSQNSGVKILTKPMRKTKILPEPSYFEYLPNDTKLEIIENMTCEQLLDAKKNNPYLSHLITPEYFTNFLNKGYPRQSLRAKLYMFGREKFINEDFKKINRLIDQLKFRKRFDKSTEMSIQDQKDLESILSVNYSDLLSEGNRSKILSANVIINNIKNSP